MSNRKKDYANLEKFRKTRNDQRRRYYKRTQKYEARLWTKEEDMAVLDHTITDTELSKKIRRSVGTIQTRRYYLKKTNQLQVQES